MKTDLVSELRRYAKAFGPEYPYATLCKNAADEIELLRNERDGHLAVCDRLRSEVKMLVLMLHEAADTLEHCRYSEIPIAKKCREVLSKVTQHEPQS